MKKWKKEENQIFSKSQAKNEDKKIRKHEQRV